MQDARNNDYSLGLGRTASQQADEVRPIASTMIALASAIGDLETAARALAGRISPLLPAGSPFSRAEKEAALTGHGTQAPRPVRSQLNDELQCSPSRRASTRWSRGSNSEYRERTVTTNNYRFMVYRATGAPTESRASMVARLRALRARAIAKGMRLLTLDEINRDVPR